MKGEEEVEVESTGEEVGRVRQQVDICQSEDGGLLRNSSRKSWDHSEVPLHSHQVGYAEKGENNKCWRG